MAAELNAFGAWLTDNDVSLVDPQRDAYYKYDAATDANFKAEQPWKTLPNYFRNVRISAVALMKMTMHARSGGHLEVMGLMQGYVMQETFIVTDAFRLPVEGTETRVNAQDEANEYIVEYLDLCRKQGRAENVVGWYHSHPGYGCWLSGIDVDTQSMQQSWSDPFLAIVIDPDRTISAGKVEIGAFRTYPTGYKATLAGTSDGSEAVPLAKAAEFGAHANRYYSLEVSHFKSSLDSHLLELLWHKYWVQTLSQSQLLTSREYGNSKMLDLSSKIRESTRTISRRPGTLSIMAGPSRSVDSDISQHAAEAASIASKEKTGLLESEIKAKIFNNLGTAGQ